MRPAAVRHAKDIEGLARLRRALRATVQSSPLFDGAHVARAIEGAAQEAFKGWSRSGRGSVDGDFSTRR